MIPTFRRASTRTSQILAPNNFFRRSCGFKRDARWPGSSQSHRVRVSVRVSITFSECLCVSTSVFVPACFFLFPISLSLLLCVSVSSLSQSLCASFSVYFSASVFMCFFQFQFVVHRCMFLSISICLSLCVSLSFSIYVWFLLFVFLSLSLSLSLCDFYSLSFFVHVFLSPSLTLSPFLSLKAKRLYYLDVDFLINQFSSGIRWLWDHIGHLIHDGAFFNRGFLFLSAETFINLPRFNLLVEKEMFAANRLNFSFHDILWNRRRFCFWSWASSRNILLHYELLSLGTKR